MYSQYLKNSSLTCLLLSLFIAVCIKDVSAIIEFILRPEDKVIPLGSELILNCHAKETSSPDTALIYTWTKAYGELSGKASMARNNSLFMYRIGEEDYGMYICNVTRPDNTNYTEMMVTSSANVIQPFLDGFVSSPSSLVLEAGQLAVFECITGESTPSPIIYWEHDNTRVTFGRTFSGTYGESYPLKLIMQKSMKLEFVATKARSGDYVCVAENHLKKMIKRSSPALLTIIGGDLPPVIVQSSPVDVIAPRGQPLQLLCVVTADPPPNVTWVKNGDVLVIQDGVTRANDSSLLFTSVSVTDAGDYFCFAENMAGNASSNTSRVNVTYLDFDFLVEPSDVSVISDDQAHISCSPPNSNPPASIIWYKDNLIFPPRSGDHAVSQTQSGNIWNLHFMNVQSSDAGQYQCIAINKFTRPTSHSSGISTLTVTVKTRLKERPLDTTVIKGEMLTLFCRYEGDETPSIHWFIRGEEILASSRINFRGARQEMYIANIHAADEGEYMCVLGTSVRNITATAYVTVIVPPIIKWQIGHVTGVYSRDVVLPCDVTGSPQPTVTWYKDGAQLTMSSHYDVTSDRLTIISVTEADTGQYVCHATNTGGEASVNGTLAVLGHPSFTIKPSDITVMINQSASFHCEAVGNPPPNITWTYNDTLALPVDVNISSDGSLIMISRVTWKHRGRYTCEAQNSINSASTSAVLYIQVAAVVNKIEGSTIIVVSDHMSLACIVTAGTPQPNIIWQHYGSKVMESPDGRITFPSSNSLLVKFVTLSDAGNYTCHATNLVGAAAASAFVYIIDKPKPPLLYTPRSVSMTTVTLMWNPVDQLPETPVTHFVIYYKHSPEIDYGIYNDNISEDVNQYEVEGLSPGNKYLFMVAAGNRVGVGKPSSAKAAKTLETAPSAPNRVNLILSTANSVNISWQMPMTTNGQIKLYEVRYRPSPTDHAYYSLEITNPSLPLQQYQIRNLHPYTVYEVRIRAATIVNEVSMWGNLSDVLEVTTLPAVPSGNPRNVSAEALPGGRANITWQLPLEADQNGPLKRFYVLYADVNLNSSYTTLAVEGAETTSTWIENLLPWRLYSVQVQAENVVGLGPRSKPLTLKTLPTAPSRPPQALQASAISAQTIQVAWKPVAVQYRNGEITGYTLKYWRSSSQDGDKDKFTLNLINADRTSISISNLLPWTIYSVHISAYNNLIENGQGPYSTAITVTTMEAAPGPVRSVTFTLSWRSVNITWDPPLVPNGRLMYYVVTYMEIGHVEMANDTNSNSTESTDLFSIDEVSDIITFQTTEAMAQLTDLNSSSIYDVMIAAVTKAGAGALVSIEVTTPPMPDISTSSIQTSTSIVVNSSFRGVILGSTAAPDTEAHTLPVIVAGSLTAAILLIFLIVLILCKWLQAKRRRSSEKLYMSKVLQSIEETIAASTNDSTARDLSTNTSNMYNNSTSTPPSSQLTAYDQAGIRSVSVIEDAAHTEIPAVASQRKPSTNNPLDASATTSTVTGMTVDHGTQTSLPRERQLFTDAESVTSGVANPVYVEESPSQETYAQDDTLGRRKHRMKSEIAAAIAIQRNRNLHFLSGDKDMLIDNDAEVVFDERTAL